MLWRRLLAGGLFAAGLMAAAAGVPACSSPQDRLASPCTTLVNEQSGDATCQVKLTLLHTADIHSRLLPYNLLITQIDGDLGLGPVGELRNVGGAARMSYIIKREKARSDRVLHISGGDVFQGAPIGNFFAGEPEMKVQAALDVKAMVIANHEFDKGAVNIANQMQKWASFPVLAANYKFDNPALPSSTPLGTLAKPYMVYNEGGLKVAIIGMANLSSLTSIFDQPNKIGVMPINTVETVQFYVDLLRPLADVIVVDTHMGLEVDQRIIRQTTGIDVLLGSHNHIVINPPQVIRDCSTDPQAPGYIWMVDPKLDVALGKPPPDDAEHSDPVNHPYQIKRTCKPRNVVLAHSGAFAKYVGRLDLVLSNVPAEATPTGTEGDYEKVNGFEVVSHTYQAFPVNEAVPEDPVVVELLQPYKRTLDIVANLDVLVGFSPTGARRFGSQGGDSPLGNLIATAMWLRLGVQTDFSLTNSTGIRQDLLPGPITVEQMYNIFPFDNSISKMQLSGVEVVQMFDFVARRSAGRGCAAQAQVAGIRVRINCNGCNRAVRPSCTEDADCPTPEPGACDQSSGMCNLTACAENIYIGTRTIPDPNDASKTVPLKCLSDVDCKDADGNPSPGACSKENIGSEGVCMAPIFDTNLYELATSNYLAGGGSGYRVLQRNTTQVDTKIQQRDALVDYLQQGKPCGWKVDAGTKDGLKACESDADCASEGDFVCACANGGGNTNTSPASGGVSCQPNGALCNLEPNDPTRGGRCVRHDCRDQVAAFHSRRCRDNPDFAGCLENLGACVIGGETCKFLSCVDETIGAITDNRMEMLGR